MKLAFGRTERSKASSRDRTNGNGHRHKRTCGKRFLDGRYIAIGMPVVAQRKDANHRRRQVLHFCEERSARVLAAHRNGRYANGRQRAHEDS
ncbi:hypothetical protein [Burkholderia sp. Leaf177]|uniref:hypothetical protein n=1 Tax=Burkholderia sp. Leaf177 TaxID=1736287 RepID=UPI001F199670|nr:hypothetical protein [Burkholderia sp. Leaf177]